MKTQKQEKTSLILHGHFYQPPRENPRTGIIGKQLSASPFPDWNERIHADCYSANSHSRYLSGVRRILSMTNNYAYISFNFGPTLLSWMEKRHPNTYALILEADKQSKQRLGHGNAIAQAYNHSILPLATEADAKDQILWGLDDFSRRFGRDAEGLWLPETAISPMVTDLLGDAGVKYVILSPWQCKALQSEDGQRIDLNGKPAPYGRAFKLTGAKGNTINAFFYNPQLAEGISFGHYLRDADMLYERLLTIAKTEGQNLIHTATDGEIYGHHEPYGDMALAALIKKVHDREDFQFTNYATYLAQHPATEEAILHDGEEAKGTSWSCSHGVSRWYRDCGCHTGGDESWNQKWRTPLRQAFDHLSCKLDAIFEKEVTNLLGTEMKPRDLLHSFSPVILAHEDMDTFLSRHTKDPDTKEALAKLLLGQKYKHFSFTSCGWFFNDLAGLEPRQNIVYALMALRLYEGFTKESLLELLLEDLQKAKANRKQDGTGRTLALEAMKELSGEVEAALFFTLNRRIALQDDYQETYGYFRLDEVKHENPETMVLAISNTQSLDRYLCTIIDPHPEAAVLQYTITIQSRVEESQTYFLTHEDIPLRMRDQLFTQIDRNVCMLDEKQIKELSHNLYHYASLAKNVPYLPMGSLYQQLIGASLSAIKSLFTYGTLTMWDEFKSDFELMLDFFLKYGKQPDLELIASIFDSEMINMAKKVQTYGLHDANCRFMLEFLEIVREKRFQPDLTAIQDAVYPYLCMQKKTDSDADIALVNALGKVLNFDIAIC
jgi:hypothetical protein